MAYLLVACPQCGAPYRFDKQKIGNRVSCSKCGHEWSPATTGDAVSVAARPAKEPTPSPAIVELAKEQDTMVGRRIDSFEVLQRIGSGGFGVVYRAFDTELERSVALKVLPRNLARSGQHRIERFLREARSAARLAHPNVVTIHEIRPFKDTYYIVMEFIDGGALDVIMTQRGRAFPPKEATRIVTEAARGLGHAHRRGIIHRDIKPGNIMLSSDGVVKVSDFGLARDVMRAEDIIREGFSAGTPHYMAPEQAMGEEPTAASDLYALGATYYTILTGRPPFEAEDFKTLVEMHRQLPPPDPRSYVPNLPAAVFRVIEKALGKEPFDRFHTADEMIEALEQIDFSQYTDAELSPQAITAQIQQLTPEDRGSYLSDVMLRAAKRLQQTTVVEVASIRPRRGRRVWLILLIIIGIAAFLGAMITLAFVLSGE